MFDLFQVGRRPVQNAVAQQINEDVSDRDVPQQLVRQNVLHKDLLRRQLFFVLFTIVIRIVVFILFDRRQTAGLRGIAHHREGKNRQQDRAESRHIQRRVPVVKPRHPQQEQQRRNTAADVMRAVPHRDNPAALFLRPPVHHGPAARRPAHPLEPAAEEQQYEHDHDAGSRPRYKAHHQHHQRGEDQAGRQENARIRAVRDRAHDEFRKSVGDGDAGKGETEVATGEALLNQIRHRQGKVLTNQIVSGITKKDANKNLPA